MLIVSMIHNLKDNRWHPVYFRPAPLPGPDGEKFGRYRSGGHHTDGFPTRDEALAGAKEIGEKLHAHSGAEVRYSLAADFPWDGEDVPAMTAFFDDSPEPEYMF